MQPDDEKVKLIRLSEASQNTLLNIILTTGEVIKGKVSITGAALESNIENSPEIISSFHFMVYDEKFSDKIIHFSKEVSIDFKGIENISIITAPIIAL